MPDDTPVGPNHELAGRSRSDAREIAHVLMRFQPGGRSKLVFIGILSLVSGLSEAAVIALVSATAVATAQKDPSVNISVVSLSPPTTLVVALGLILTGLAATSLMANIFSKVTSNAAYEARREIVDVFHRASYQRKSRDRLAGLQEVLTTYVDRLGSAFSALIMFISAVLSTLSFAIAAVVVSPFAALLIGVIGGLLAAVLQPATRLTRRASRSLAEQRQHYADGATESVLLARTVRIRGCPRRGGEIAESGRRRCSSVQDHQVPADDSASHLPDVGTQQCCSRTPGAYSSGGREFGSCRRRSASPCTIALIRTEYIDRHAVAK